MPHVCFLSMNVTSFVSKVCPSLRFLSLFLLCILCTYFVFHCSVIVRFLVFEAFQWIRQFSTSCHHRGVVGRTTQPRSLLGLSNKRSNLSPFLMRRSCKCGRMHLARVVFATVWMHYCYVDFQLDYWVFVSLIPTAFTQDHLQIDQSSMCRGSDDPHSSHL